MQVVIQHPITNHFLTSSGEWKNEIQDARLFDSSADAVTHCALNLRPPYNVVLKFENPQYDVTVLASDSLKVLESQDIKRTARH